MRKESFWLRLLLRALRPPAAEDRESIWAVSRKWLPFYIGLISVMTFAWMWVISEVVIESGEYDNSTETLIAVMDRSSSAVPLIVLVGVCVTYWLDILGGLLMVTARYLSSKFVTPIVERHKSEGRSEMHNAWLAWYRKSEEAKAKGIPFDDPPPELPTDPGKNGR